MMMLEEESNSCSPNSDISRRSLSRGTAMALDILPNVTARSYGATATFGCYVAFFRYVRLLAYLLTIFVQL